jgi:hypothetical protein
MIQQNDVLPDGPQQWRSIKLSPTPRLMLVAVLGLVVVGLLVILSGCGDVYIAASEHGDAAVTIEQAHEPPEPASPTAVPSDTEPTTSDHVAEIVAGFFVNTWGAVLLLALLAWLLFPPGDRERWR